MPTSGAGFFGCVSRFSAVLFQAFIFEVIGMTTPRKCSSAKRGIGLYRGIVEGSSVKLV